MLRFTSIEERIESVGGVRDGWVLGQKLLFRHPVAHSVHEMRVLVLLVHPSIRTGHETVRVSKSHGTPQHLMVLEVKMNELEWDLVSPHVKLT